MMLLEPATTITDFVLTIECLWFAVALLRTRAPGYRRSAFLVLFVSIAAAALLGGIVHGFFADDGAPTPRVLWLLTLLAIGVTAAAMVAVAADLQFHGGGRGVLSIALTAGWLAYAAVVLLWVREFWVAIVAYLPAVLLLLAALIGYWHRRRSAGAVAGIIGVLLALIGAAGQQAGVALHPVHFDHNAVYHVLQMVALYLLYRLAREVGASDVAA